MAEEGDDDLIFLFGNGSSQMQFPGLFFTSSNHGRTDLNTLIQHLMNGMQIDRRQNPGIDEQNLQKLPIVKFNKNTNGKHSPNCTICIKDYN